MLAVTNVDQHAESTPAGNDGAGDGGAEVRVRRLREDDWQQLRPIRLEALQEAPMAFGSTYAREVAFTEADWRARLGRTSVMFLAYGADPNLPPIGMAGGYQPDWTPGAIELVGMWVRPSARGQHVADPLVEAVVGWAREVGAADVRLWLAEGNTSAQRLYSRLGFVETGERQPLPHDETRTEIGMIRPAAPNPSA
jgi:GNAT superfamily N-acetyltransferase